MGTVTGRDAVFLTVLQNFMNVLGDKSIDLWSPEGRVVFPLNRGLPALAEKITTFQQTNNRLPKVIFNDGKPPQFAEELKAKSAGHSLLTYFSWLESHYGGASEANDSGVIESGVVTPLFSVPVYIDPPFQAIETVTLSETGTAQNTLIYQGASPTRFGFPANVTPNYIPISNVTAGAFPTWGLLLVAAQNPEFIYLDENNGFLLTREGVQCLERAIPYWIGRATTGTMLMSPVFGSGPELVGVPFEIIDRFRQVWLQANKGFGKFFVYIIQMIAQFAAFYAGVSALASMAAGSVTFSNLQSAIKLSSQFGADTGKLGPALNLLNLTGAGNLVNNLSITAEVPSMDDYDFWADIGINPDSIDYAGAYVAEGYDFDSLWGDLDFDSIAAATDSFSEALNLPEVYDATAIQVANDAALAEIVGPVSATQFAAMVRAGPEVVNATRAVMGAGAAGSTKTAPQQAQTAAQQARHNATTAATPQEASIWQTASQMLNLYGQYQMTEAKVAAATGTSALPKSPTLPNTQAGSFARQPDGSFTVRNADGTVTTVRPNGQVVQTGGDFIDQLPAFVRSREFLYGAAALIGTGILYMLFNRSNRSH